VHVSTSNMEAHVDLEVHVLYDGAYWPRVDMHLHEYPGWDWNYCTLCFAIIILITA
jgi:hypothetical protein